MGTIIGGLIALGFLIWSSIAIAQAWGPGGAGAFLLIAATVLARVRAVTRPQLRDGDRRARP